MKNKTIGFIGTGVMGKSMVGHLLHAGWRVHLFTRTKEKAQSLIEKGAHWEENVAALAKTANIIITMIGTPVDVEQVYLAENGILENARKGTYIIDMTTSKPSLAVEIFKRAKKKELYALDAPVSGGDIGAKSATLTIMVGGEREPFERMRSLFNTLGENIILQGGPGAGQHTKMVNQISIAPAMIGIAEALIYAEKAGLNPATVLKSISKGAAGSWSLDNYAPRMIVGDLAPGFAIKHFIKDMQIALEAAEEMKLTTPGLSLAYEMYEALVNRGNGESGIHALINYYKDK